MRKQFELRFIAGVADSTDSNRFQAFCENVIQGASALCGGCYVGKGEGYWIDGETHAETFTGTVEREKCLDLQLTTEEDKLERVLEKMQTVIKNSARLYNLDMEWIHCQQIEIVGRHFSIKV